MMEADGGPQSLGWFISGQRKKGIDRIDQSIVKEQGWWVAGGWFKAHQPPPSPSFPLPWARPSPARGHFATVAGAFQDEIISWWFPTRPSIPLAGNSISIFDAIDWLLNHIDRQFHTWTWFTIATVNWIVDWWIDANLYRLLLAPSTFHIDDELSIDS